jgi:Undecaprenyl-phosphate glucose phosphotransferase
LVDGVIQERIGQGRAAAAPSSPAEFRWSPDLVPGLVHAVELAGLALVGALLCTASAYVAQDYFQQYVFCAVFVVISYSYLTRWASLVHLNAYMRPIAQADNVVVALMTSFLFLLSILYGLDVAYIMAWQWLATFFAAGVAMVLGVRLTAFSVLKLLSRRRVIGRNLVVLGTGPQGARFLRSLNRDQPYFTEVLGVFAAGERPRGDRFESFPVLGDIGDLLREARAGTVDDIVVAMPWSADRTVIETVETLKELPVNVYLGSDLVGFDLTFRPVLGAFSQLPVFEVVQRPISGWSSALKRLLDYGVATALLLGLSPLLLLIALAIKLDSPGPVFFMQQRLGFNNKPFAIFKFRSMYHQRVPEHVVRQARKGDPRVTRVGRIIRATSLDELPQLLNVIDGTMSLVGPRPHALSHNEEYGKMIRGYFARHKVRPGITGWAQVNGLRGETENVEKMQRRVEHDVYYAENWSLLFDIKILLMTAVVVLFQKAAY